MSETAGGRTVLVAEDIAYSRLLIQQALRRDGHTVLLAPDGVEAVDIARAVAPDLALLDINLPKQDGLETLRQLRKVVGDLPVIVMSAYLDPVREQQFREMGVSMFMRKPLDIDTLRETVLLMLGTDYERPEEPEGALVLLALDDAHLREAARKVLAAKGLLVAEAADEAEMRTKLRNQDISLVILDVCLFTDLEAVQEDLAALHQDKEALVICSPDQAALEQTLPPAAKIITKPVRLDELVRAAIEATEAVRLPSVELPANGAHE